MGLDMYFYERHYFPKKQNKRGLLVPQSFTVATQPYGKAKKRFKDVIYITCRAGYFRKANAIHWWILENCWDCDDKDSANCKQIYVPSEKIQELKDICLKLLRFRGRRFKEEAFDLLPTHAGFFWGSTEYDKWYRKDLIAFVKMANKLHLDEPYIDLFYEPSW